MSETVPVGDCESCGVVTDEDIEYRFPNASRCEQCGAELNRVKMVEEARLEELRGE